MGFGVGLQLHVRICRVLVAVSILSRKHALREMSGPKILQRKSDGFLGAQTKPARFTATLPVLSVRKVFMITFTFGSNFEKKILVAKHSWFFWNAA